MQPIPSPPGAHPRKRPTTRVARECAYAEETLGTSHPLSAALRSSRTAREQALTIAAVQAADLMLLLENARLALSLALACLAMQIMLGGRIACLAWRKREMCRRLIIDGRGRLPLGAVQRELRRLEATTHQATLAESVDRLVDAATDPGPTPLFALTIYHVCVVRAVAAELREVALLLRSGNVAVRGVAHVESLLTSGESPLYGLEVEPLRDELGRARYFLADRLRL